MRQQSLPLFPVILLYLIGCITIFDASAGELIDINSQRSLWSALIKQITFGIMGAGLGCVLYRIGWRKVLEVSPILLYIGIFLLLCVFVPGIGVSANGAKRWVNLLGFTLQPSEFIKYLAPFYLIDALSKSSPLSNKKQLYKILAPIGVCVLLILLQPNNGTAFVISITSGVLILLMRVPVRFWIAPALCLVALSLVFAWKKGYVRARIASYMNPEADIKGKGHQPYQAKIAAGSGGFYGLGVGRSMQKLSYLPEAQNDYIAAIYAEEFGFIGMLGLIGCYVTLGLAGLRISLESEDPRAQLVSGTIVFLYCFQAFMNLGVVSGLLPSTGLNLPFFSQGGSSLIANLGGLGILLQCSRDRSIYGLTQGSIRRTSKIVELQE